MKIFFARSPCPTMSRTLAKAPGTQTLSPWNIILTLSITVFLQAWREALFAAASEALRVCTPARGSAIVSGRLPCGAANTLELPDSFKVEKASFATCDAKQARYLARPRVEAAECVQLDQTLQHKELSS